MSSSVVDLSSLEAANAHALMFEHAARPDTRWCVISLCEPQAGKGQAKAYIKALGAGGTDQMMQHMPEDEVTFGVYRVVGTDSAAGGAPRVKVVFLTYLGPKVPRVRKAQAAPVKEKIRAFFKGHHVDMDVHEACELSHEEVERKLRASGGAFQPDTYVFGVPGAGPDTVHTYGPTDTIPADVAGPGKGAGKGGAAHAAPSAAVVPPAAAPAAVAASPAAPAVVAASPAAPAAVAASPAAPAAVAASPAAPVGGSPVAKAAPTPAPAVEETAPSAEVKDEAEEEAGTQHAHQYVRAVGTKLPTTGTAAVGARAEGDKVMTAGLPIAPSHERQPTPAPWVHSAPLPGTVAKGGSALPPQLPEGSHAEEYATRSESPAHPGPDGSSPVPPAGPNADGSPSLPVPEGVKVGVEASPTGATPETDPKPLLDTRGIDAQEEVESEHAAGHVAGKVSFVSARGGEEEGEGEGEGAGKPMEHNRHSSVGHTPFHKATAGGEDVEA